CILEYGAGAQSATEHRRTRHHIAELPTYSHNLVCVCDSLEILAVGRIRGFCRHKRGELARLEALAKDQSPITSQSRVDEILCEALCLCLDANEESNPQNYSAQTKQ